jgi:hypothetical protein
VQLIIKLYVRTLFCSRYFKCEEPTFRRKKQLALNDKKTKMMELAIKWCRQCYQLLTLKFPRGKMYLKHTKFRELSEATMHTVFPQYIQFQCLHLTYLFPFVTARQFGSKIAIYDPLKLKIFLICCPSLPEWGENRDRADTVSSRMCVVTCLTKYQMDGIIAPQDLEEGVLGWRFPQQQIWKFLGNRAVEAYIHGNTKTNEKQLLKVGISFAVLP